MADIRWNSVNANFNDVNSAMSNALNGISKAGTVFGELRKSILDQEQRAIDNAYREKMFDENIRQFDLQNDLANRKFLESTRQFDLGYDLDVDRFNETARHNLADESLRGRDLSIRGAANTRAQAEFDRELADREAIQRWHQTAMGKRADADKQIQATQEALNAETDPDKRKNLELRLNALNKVRQDITARSLDDDIRMGIAADRGLLLDKTGMTSAADAEKMFAANAIQQRSKDLQARQKEDDTVRGNLMKDENIDPKEREHLMEAFNKARAMPQYRNIPASSMMDFIKSKAGDKNLITRNNNFSNAKQVLRDIENGNSPIHLQLTEMTLPYQYGTEYAENVNRLAKLNAVNNAPQKVVQTGEQGDLGDISQMSEKGLNYLESDLRHQESRLLQGIDNNSQNVKDTYAKLKRQEFGNMPEDKMSKSDHDRLMKQARTMVQDASAADIRRARKALDQERKNRLANELLEEYYEAGMLD